MLQNKWLMMEALFKSMELFFLKGLQNTIIISLIGVVCGAIIGSFIALAKLSKFKIISLPATIYIEFLRGTPMLVQVFIVFLALPRF